MESLSAASTVILVYESTCIYSSLPRLPGITLAVSPHSIRRCPRKLVERQLCAERWKPLSRKAWDVRANLAQDVGVLSHVELSSRRSNRPLPMAYYHFNP